MSKKIKTVEEVRLLIAQLLNQENDQYALLTAQIPKLTAFNPILETLEYAHKEKIMLLERIYREL